MVYDHSYWQGDCYVNNEPDVPGDLKRQLKNVFDNFDIFFGQFLFAAR